MSMNNLITTQRIEGAAVFAAGIVVYLSVGAGLPWWLALLVFFAPDLGFAAYLFGPRLGALGYNLVHVYGFGAVVMACGMVSNVDVVTAIGALWLAHSGFDRMLGYGLKLSTGFKYTNLGVIGGAE